MYVRWYMYMLTYLFEPTRPPPRRLSSSNAGGFRLSDFLVLFPTHTRMREAFTIVGVPLLFFIVVVLLLLLLLVGVGVSGALCSFYHKTKSF